MLYFSEGFYICFPTSFMCLQVLKLSLSFFLHAKEHLTCVLIKFDCSPLSVLRLEI